MQWGSARSLSAVLPIAGKKKRELEVVQKQLNLSEHSLKTECQTRYGSRQAMTERILEQQKAVAQVLSNDRKLRHLTLSWQDVDVLEAVNKSLSPLVEFTDALSGEKYVSVLWQPSPKPSGHRIPPISTSQRQRASIASL